MTLFHVTDDHVLADQLIESKHSFAPLSGSRLLHPEFQFITERNEWLTASRRMRLGDIAQRGGFPPPLAAPAGLK
jgi:hypothetical protein